mgnify:CR=1 FL=1
MNITRRTEGKMSIPYILIVNSVNCEDSHTDEDSLFCLDINGNINVNFYANNSITLISISYSLLVSSFHA